MLAQKRAIKAQKSAQAHEAKLMCMMLKAIGGKATVQGWCLMCKWMGHGLCNWIVQLDG